MKRANKLSLILFILLLISPAQNELVYNQLEDIYSFAPNIPQVVLPIDLGSDFIQSQQFAVWGWIRPSQTAPAISNIVSLTQSVLQVDTTQDQNQDVIVENNVQVNTEPIQTYQVQDLVAINYELNVDFETFNIGFTYLGQNNQHYYDVIQNLPRNDVWTFFAFSADYKNGNVVMYVKTIDGSAGNYKQDRQYFPELYIRSTDSLIVGGTNERLYETFTQYIGEISNIQMSRFFISELDYQWAGYIPNNIQNNDLLLEFTFDIYEMPATLEGRGLNSVSLYLENNFRPLYMIDNNKVGVRFYQNAQLPLGAIDFTNGNSPIRGALFFFDLTFDDSLGDDFILLTRGDQNYSGFMQISLSRNQNARIVRVILKGDDTTQLITFDSPTDLAANQRHQFMVGVAQGPGDYLLPIYIDFKENFKFGPYVENYPFDFGPQIVVLFNPNPLQNNNDINNQDNIVTGPYVDMLRFLVFNNASPAINFKNRSSPNLQAVIANRPQEFDQEQLCKFRSSYYDGAFCLLCQDSILYQDQCVTYCPEGTKNGLTDVCVPCYLSYDQQNVGQLGCPELDLTTWIYTPIEENRTYLVEPTRTILNPNINIYPTIFQVLLLNPVTGINEVLPEQFTITPQGNQQFLLQSPNNNLNLTPLNYLFFFNQNLEDPLYDVNRNLLGVGELRRGSAGFDNNLIITGDENYYYCIDIGNRGLKMRILAYILLLSYAGTAFLLLLFTLCCWKRFWDLGGLWKFMLHHWMKLNLVAFFILLAINMPCCVREFLHQLYRFAVSWDHELRHWINNCNDDSRDYNRAFIQRRLPFQFRVEHVRPFILHNLLITFIAQLAIAAIYIILKLWDYLNVWKRSCVFRLFIFWEFTALIVGYLLFHMRDFVFSGLNYREAIFSHSYFVCCFLIAIFYILVFALFWFYSLIILLTRSLTFWSDITNVNKFYYFFVGYRNNRLARTYDHWVTLAHLAVAMMIGIVIYSALAQMIVIVSVLGVLFVITLVLRPWRSIVLLLCDIIAQIAILVTVIFFLVYSIQDTDGRCITCHAREDGNCWVIVLFLFICLMIGLLGLLLAMLMDCCRRAKRVIKTREDIYHYNEETEVINTEQNIHRVDHGVYENVNARNVVMGGAMMGGERIVSNEYHHNNTINRDGHVYNTSVNQVQGVQPDVVEDGSVQHEMLNAMNEKSHVQNTLSRNDVNLQNQYLQDERSQFYNTVNKDSNVDLYRAKNLGANENVFNDEIKVTKFTKTTTTNN